MNQKTINMKFIKIKIGNAKLKKDGNQSISGGIKTAR